MMIIAIPKSLGDVELSQVDVIHNTMGIVQRTKSSSDTDSVTDTNSPSVNPRSNPLSAPNFKPKPSSGVNSTNTLRQVTLQEPSISDYRTTIPSQSDKTIPSEFPNADLIDADVYRHIEQHRKRQFYISLFLAVATFIVFAVEFSIFERYGYSKGFYFTFNVMTFSGTLLQYFLPILY
jgi:hypothetical protein